MQITLDLMQLLLVLLVIAGIGVLVVVFIVLIRLLGTMKRLDSIAKDATIVLAAASENVPTILKNGNVVTSAARDGVEAIGGAAHGVEEGVASLFHLGSDAEPGKLELILGIIDQAMSLVEAFASHRKKKGGSGRRRK